MNQAITQHDTAAPSTILLPHDYYRSLLTGLPPFGTKMEGGRFVNIFHCESHVYGLVVAPKADGEMKGRWGKTDKLVAATHVADGLANTLAMAEAGSKIAKDIMALTIGGHNDWHIGARDQNELLYRMCKPTTAANWCYYRSGDNPSSLPPGLPYQVDAPIQTTLEDFKPGEPYTFEDASYWSSTQYSAGSAFCQGFGDGDQGTLGKGTTLRVRAVRRFLIY